MGGAPAPRGARRYSALARPWRPRPAAAAQLVTLVQSLGPADAQGWHQLRRKGVLP
ncbi:MAG: hypothetical protein ACT4PK_08745 [Gammaproteobacteria bacterium]